MFDKDMGCLGMLIGGALALVALCLIVVYVLPAVVLVGASYGGFVALKNYLVAFTRNVRPETDPNGVYAKFIAVLLVLCLCAGLYFVIANLTRRFH
jgi:hypothetical protein